MPSTVGSTCRFPLWLRCAAVVWLAIWLFYLMDWIGQDYLSPQAFGLFLFLVAIAVITRWFAAGDGASSTDGSAAGSARFAFEPRRRES